MARGTVVTYQGHRVQSMRFRRTRGYEADVTTVTFPVADFPDGFEFEEPLPGELLGEIPREVPDVAAMLAGAVPEGPPARLRFAGYLVIADFGAVPAQDLEPVVIGPLFVTRVDRVRRSERPGGPYRAMIQVSLVDERFFWGSRGCLLRWSYNRVRGDGSIALDSVRPDGEPFSFWEIARDVTGSLFRHPQLATAPEEWKLQKSAREFSAKSMAVLALGEVVRVGKVEEPCLRLDGTVALHKTGDGLVGWAPSGKGPNTEPFPAEVRASKRGTGQGYSLEPTYNEDWLIVRGRERIASVQIDEWEPVLVLPTRVANEVAQVEAEGEGPPREFSGERVVPLTDDVVRKLSRGRLRLKSLAKWVLLPPAWQNAVGLDESVAQILREQAWRLWRLPGVEEPDDEGGTKLGPNAHLLPLLPRAETAGGQRFPVLVETYRFHTTHRLMLTTASASKLEAARRALQELREAIQRAAAVRQLPDPFGPQVKGDPDTTNPFGFKSGLDDQLGVDDLLGDLVDQLGEDDGTERSASLEGAQAMLDRLHLVDRIREVDPSLAELYAKKLGEEFSAADENNATALGSMFELAQKAHELEQKLRELRQQRDSILADDPNSLKDFLEQRGDDPGVRALREQARNDFEAILRKIAQQREQARQLRTSPVDAANLEKSQYAHFVRNVDRDVDTKASLYSDRLGIVRTSTLAGWVEKEGVRAPEFTRFVPKPVRVTFGATVRPKIDKPPPLSTQTSAGGPPRVPPELSDDVTWFQRAFARTPSGYIKVKVEDVPVGEGTVVPLELHELIPLEGDGNTGELEARAEDLAQQRLLSRPRVQGETITLARAWPVQCDGLVAAVEITTRDGPGGVPGTGVETKVTVGSGRAPDPAPLRSTGRRRPPRPAAGDGGRREGLTP